MPTTAKILKGGGHQVTNTAGTDERFAGRAVCREGGLRSWKRWAPWKTHWGKRASFTIFRSTFSSSHRYVTHVSRPRRARRRTARGARRASDSLLFDPGEKLRNEAGNWSDESIHCMVASRGRFRLSYRLRCELAGDGSHRRPRWPLGRRGLEY
jgi:hypothetical protein